MVSLKFYLDLRHYSKKNDGYRLKLMIYFKQKTAPYPLELYLKKNQFDQAKEKVKNHPYALEINDTLSQRRSKVAHEIFMLSEQRRLSSMTVFSLRDYLLEKKKMEMQPEPVEGSFYKTFQAYIDLKQNRQTASLYERTLKKITRFVGEKDVHSLVFEDISVSWLRRFDNFMAKTAPSANARAIDLRNLRAVMNHAIDNDLTVHYPFRRFKIKHEPTRKRTYDIDTLRKIFNYQPENKSEEWALDYFKLTFMLIGINPVDMFGLKEITDGRIEYRRAKTKVLYSIKVEPEAQAIIDKYKSRRRLLGYFSRYKTYRNFYQVLTRALGRIKKKIGISDLTTYWARHTWATYAYILKVPFETISYALGHSSANTVTHTYVDISSRLIDEANRKVLDYVLYGIGTSS